MAALDKLTVRGCSGEHVTDCMGTQGRSARGVYGGCIHKQAQEHMPHVFAYCCYGVSLSTPMPQPFLEHTCKCQGRQIHSM